jgi:glutathione S-transferase
MAGVSYRAYVLDVSYFSGKLEAYLRYKEIPFERIEPSWPEIMRKYAKRTGMVRVPFLETPDGEWLYDTTPTIDWLEARHPEPPVVPACPVQGFAARLLEDYADEWLWRPALHYRWSYRTDALHLSRRIAEEAFPRPPVPRALLRWNLRRRQRKVYVSGDGVTPETRDHVEGTYLGSLDRLERLLAERPFLLGGRPCLADFGFFASMFRHFSLDPTPAKIMRQRAPGVFAWVARLWDARASRLGDADWPAPGTLPEVWSELLAEVGETYLPYLHANALAWRDGAKRVDYTVQGVTYRQCPVVHYRVWCRERLQDHFEALPAEGREAVRKLLESCGAWEPLFCDGRIPSGLHAEGSDPAVRRSASLRERAATLRDPWNPGPDRSGAE